MLTVKAEIHIHIHTHFLSGVPLQLQDKCHLSANVGEQAQNRNCPDTGVLQMNTVVVP
jgi:hypothetical protein